MSRTSIISVSLPKRTIEQVRRYARARRTTVSATVQASLDVLWRREEEAQVEREFADYYSDPNVRDEEARLAEETLRASAWWEEVHDRSVSKTRRGVHRRLLGGGRRH